MIISKRLLFKGMGAPKRADVGVNLYRRKRAIKAALLSAAIVLPLLAILPLLA